MWIFYFDRQQFWKCDRIINIKQKQTSDMRQLSELQIWHRRGYENKRFIASCADKEYMYGNYISTKKLKTIMTAKREGDWLVKWLMLGFMNLGRPTVSRRLSCWCFKAPWDFIEVNMSRYLKRICSYDMPIYYYGEMHYKIKVLCGLSREHFYDGTSNEERMIENHRPSLHFIVLF